jgi:guanosine-3',5'-bis(diphosphate) 3'-pyrophosphohydrolase
MSPSIHPLIISASALATRAHEGQERDDGGGPYIRHPARVAATLARHFPGDHALVAAAWCHDVLEDCPQVGEAELRAAIGDDALALVREVTNPSKGFPDLPRAERKAMDRAHIAVISRRAKLIKLADRADNLREGAGSPDKAWIATYVGESRTLAEVLKGTDEALERDLADALERAARSAAGT